MIADAAPPPLQTPVWRGMNRNELDRAYDNSTAVAKSADYLAGWSRKSAALRSNPQHLLDLPYGSRERNRIDIFRCEVAEAPLVVFIHGGYWQRNSKEIFATLAEGLLAQGVDVALPGYTLAPEASLEEILGEIRTALAFLRRHGPNIGLAKRRLIVSGWSAGGHLAASTMDMREVDAGLAISGIFDLEPIRLGILNDKLGLSKEDVATLSPIQNIPNRAGELTIAYGTAELPELQRQSNQYAASWLAAGRTGSLLPVENADHFSILEDLARPEGGLAHELLRLARRV